MTLAAGTAQSVTLADGHGTLTLDGTSVSGSLGATIVATGLIEATVTGDVTIDTAADTVQARLAVRGLSIFLGGSGVGVSLSDGVVGLVIAAHGTAVEYAVDATGMVALTGVPGVTASGLIRLRRSTFAAAAVSYTHLDVYKRQRLDRAAVLRRFDHGADRGRLSADHDRLPHHPRRAGRDRHDDRGWPCLLYTSSCV